MRCAQVLTGRWTRKVAICQSAQTGRALGGVFVAFSPNYGGAAKGPAAPGERADDRVRTGVACHERRGGGACALGDGLERREEPEGSRRQRRGAERRGTGLTAGTGGNGFRWRGCYTVPPARKPPALPSHPSPGVCVLLRARGPHQALPGGLQVGAQPRYEGAGLRGQRGRG